MTSVALSPTVASWDEPEGVAPRGTLVVLTGRGESAAAYGRLGRRLSGDAYRVRVVQVHVEHLDVTRAGTATAVRALLEDPQLPEPRVLVGTDTGATLAALLLDELPVHAAVLAGLVLPSSVGPDAGPDAGPHGASWDGELEARTACPAHRRVLSQDDDFERGALARELPAGWRDLDLPVPTKPVLVLHGSQDPLTPTADAFEPFLDAERAQVRLVVGGRHDVLNDAMHRSVAATVVLFLERLRLGEDLPVIVGPVRR